MSKILLVILHAICEDISGNMEMQLPSFIGEAMHFRLVSDVQELFCINYNGNVKIVIPVRKKGQNLEIK